MVLDCFAVRFVRLHARRTLWSERSAEVPGRRGHEGGRLQESGSTVHSNREWKRWRSICKQEVERVLEVSGEAEMKMLGSSEMVWTCPEDCISQRMLTMEPPGRRPRGGLVTRYVDGVREEEGGGDSWFAVVLPPPLPPPLVMSSHSACLGCSFAWDVPGLTPFYIKYNFLFRAAHKHVYTQVYTLEDVFCLGALLLKAFVLLLVRKDCVYFYRCFWANALARVFLLLSVHYTGSALNVHAEPP